LWQTFEVAVAAEHPLFSELASRFAAGLRHAIFTDQVVKMFKDREDLLQLLKDHIKDNLVKVRAKH